MAKFETKVVLMRMDGDIEIDVVCELERDGYFYKFPMGFAKNPLLDIGDEYKVVEIEMEVQND